MSIWPRFRTGLHPLRWCLVALALAGLIGVGARPAPDATGASQQRALAQLAVNCHGAKPEAPKPLHPAGEAWFRALATSVAAPVATPPDTPAAPTPRTTTALADRGPACSPVDPGRVPEAALPRGPPHGQDQARA